jgi:UDP-glucose 4-epimerase
MERNRLKILVTGGAGFVGTNLIKILQKTYSNSEIQVIDNYVTGFIRNHQEGVTYHDVDITTEQATSLMISFQPDVIYHLAALARIQPSFKYPTPTFNANVIGTQRVLEYARTNKTPVIYAGSSSTHGGVHKNPYTFSKWLGEELCIMYSKIFDVPTIITRFYNVYGEYMIPGDHAYSTVVQIFNEQKLNNIPLTITGDGEQRRDFTHVLDICDALVTCIDHPNLKAEIFELGRGENFSINEIAKMYNHPITTLADFSKATKILGYKPFRNIKDWIQK